MFDSSAILLYLADKTGKFLPENTPAGTRPASFVDVLRRHRRRSVLGTGRALQAPCAGEVPYAINRYEFEARRHFGILDAQLAKLRYMLGDAYTIVDMNVWGWARLVPFVLGEDGPAPFPHVKRLVDEINARPAAVRALALKERHSFKTEMDDESRRNLFPGNVKSAA